MPVKEPEGNAATAEPPKVKKPAPTREYGVWVRRSGSRDQIIAALLDTLDEDVDNAQVLVYIGPAVANTPKVALKQLAQFRDLNDDYEVIAASGIAVMAGIKTEVKRTVTGL